MVGKTEKFRGSRTHGRGKKAGRGAGKRGGRGNAGLNKHKVMTMIKYMPGHLGRYGFKRPQKMVGQDISINIRDLEFHMDRFLAEGHVKKDGDAIALDLNALGYDKLLGAGEVTTPLHITIAKTSASASSKIEDAGGKIITPE